MSDRPACRACSIHREYKRTPNRATHFTVYVDGLATLTCSRHAQMAIGAGGFTIQLEAMPHVLTVELTTAELSDSLRQVARSRSDSPALGRFTVLRRALAAALTIAPARWCTNGASARDEIAAGQPMRRTARRRR